jgi:hypothetical protein
MTINDEGAGKLDGRFALAAVLAGHDVVIHSVKFLSRNASKIIAATKVESATAPRGLCDRTRR